MGEGEGAGADSPGWQAAEPHAGGIGQRLNWLRAGVLGANDGIVSTAGLVVGVAAVTPEPGPILTAGIAGLVAGGVTTIGNVRQIDRGYERIDERLRALGARIERVAD